MLTREAIIDEFSVCNRPADFSRKYYYFKKKNPASNEDEIKYILNSIEMVNPLGALYIAVLKEREIAGNFIRDFLLRNKEQIVDKIKGGSDDSVIFMEILYICMMYLNKDERLKLASDALSGSSKQLFKLFIKAIKKLDTEIAWATKYCEIMVSIYYARNNDISFLSQVEASLRNKPLGYVVDESVARKYFEILCENGHYKEAVWFLQNFDGSQGLLGYDIKELIDKLMRMPEASALSQAKWCVKKLVKEDYTYSEWCQDVLSVNSDEECRRWIKITAYYHELMVLSEENKWDEFDNKLLEAKSFEMFSVSNDKYIKQMLEAFVFICNKLLFSGDKRIISFLKAIEDININSFKVITYRLKTWNKKETVTNHDYERIEDILFSEYSVEDAVYIYMNTHLKFMIYLEDFIERCAEIVGEDVSVLFKDYPIKGTIDKGYRMNSIENKLYVTPVHFASRVSFSEYEEIGKENGWRSEETRKYNRRMLRNQGRWYSQNKNTAELIRTGDLCTVLINSFNKNKGIYVTDFVLPDSVLMERIEERNTEYPKKVLSWLADIRLAKKHIKWDEKIKLIYGVRHVEDMNYRKEIALDILNTICVLMDDVFELKRFLIDITHPPLEEINEARYIPSQKAFWFRVKEGEYSRKVSEIGKKLMADSRIDSAMKKTIYLNTIIKKYYDLYFVCEKIGDELFKGTTLEPFEFSLKCEGKTGNEYHFSSRHKNAVFYSQKDFIYRGDENTNLLPGSIYIVRLKEFDNENDCFVLADVDLENKQTDQWSKYRRSLRDIKDMTSEDDIDKIKSELRKYDVEISSVKQIREFTHELNSVFYNKHFSIDTALSILRATEETNTFEKSSNLYSELKDEFLVHYNNNYIRFLQDYRENFKSYAGFCDLYFRSYLKVFIDFETFINDILEDDNSRENIINYCRYMKYIN